MHAQQTLFDTLNSEYLQVHKAKEDLFWDTYMAISDDHAGFAKAEEAYKNFISDPVRLRQVRDALDALQTGTAPDALVRGLQGWKALFECNIVDTDAARALMGSIIAQESALFGKRRELVMHHTNEAGQREEATLSMLSTNLGTNPDAAARQSSHDALMGLEQWVLDNGFLEIVKTRNAFARAQRFDKCPPRRFSPSWMILRYARATPTNADWTS